MSQRQVMIGDRLVTPPSEIVVSVTNCGIIDHPQMWTMIEAYMDAISEANTNGLDSADALVALEYSGAD